MNRIKYCALTTVSHNLKDFVLPSVEYLYANGYNITLISKMDKMFIETLPVYFKCYDLDIERGFKFIKTIKSIFVLWRIFRKEKFEMIQYGTENVSFCASIAGAVAGIPVRIYDHWGSRYFGMKKGVLRNIVRLIEKITAFFSTDIRQVSVENMNNCINDKIYKVNKVKVLGKGGTIGVDLNIFNISRKNIYRNKIRVKHNIPNDAFVFGYVGYVRRDKGSNELISAFKKLSIEKGNTFLILNGTIYDEDKIDNELKNWANASDNVIFTGRVSNVYEYMASFDVLVHPSYREGFGMVLQEAAAYAIPIITTNIPGPREFVEHRVTGYIVNKGDSEDLYEKMKMVYLSRDERERLGNKEYLVVCKHYDRRVMLERILNDRNALYEERIVKS